MAENNKSPFRRWAIRGLLGCGGLLFLLAAALFTYSSWVSSLRIDPKLVTPPQALMPEPASTPEDSNSTHKHSNNSPKRQANPHSASQSPKNEIADILARDQSIQYEDLLTQWLKGHPGAKGPSLYLELVRQFEAEAKQGNEIYDLFNEWNIQQGQRTRNWSPRESPKPKQAAWLLGHQDFIEALLLFAQSDGLPEIGLHEIERHVKAFGQESVGGPNYLFFQTANKILCAEARRRLDQNDFDGACRCLLGSLALSGHLRHNIWAINRLVQLGMITQSGRALQGWLGKFQESLHPPLDLIIPLTQAHQRLFDQEIKLLTIKEEYAIYRMGFIKASEAGWRSPYFGWDAQDRQKRRSYYSLDVHVFDYQIIDVPRVDRLALASLKAMRRRERANDYLKEYDELFGKAINRLALDYPSMKATPKPELPQENPFFDLGWDNWDDWIIRSLVAETELNLARAALEILNDPQHTLTQLSIHQPLKDKDSPLRDPFNEQPFRFKVQEDKILLYSLGPDLVDQGGQELYDARRTIGSGDLALTVPLTFARPTPHETAQGTLP